MDSAGPDLARAMEASYNRDMAERATQKAQTLERRVETLEVVCMKLIDDIAAIRAGDRDAVVGYLRAYSEDGLADEIEAGKHMSAEGGAL